MKKVISLLVVVCLMLGCMLALNACNKKDDDEADKPQLKVNAPEGYTAWTNNDIGFAYPSAWTKTDMSGVVMLVQNSTTGENINVAVEAKTTIYSTLTTDNFLTVLGSMFEAAGASISNVTVEQTQTTNGVGVVKAVFKNTMTTSGYTVTVWQTQFYITVDQLTYSVTATAFSYSDVIALAETVEQTLVAAK